MSLFLAIALQGAVTLPADEASAAQPCAVVTLAGVGAKDVPTVETAARSTFFSIVAARAKPSTGVSFMQMNHDNTAKAFADSAKVPPSDIAPLSRQCSARFPLVDRTTVTLPSDPFQRDLTCMGGIALAAGLAAARDKRTGGNEAAPFDASAKPFIARLPTSKMPTGDGMQALMDDLVRRVAGLGTPLAIAKTCAALNAS